MDTNLIKQTSSIIQFLKKAEKIDNLFIRSITFNKNITVYRQTKKGVLTSLSLSPGALMRAKRK